MQTLVSDILWGLQTVRREVSPVGFSNRKFALLLAGLLWTGFSAGAWGQTGLLGVLESADSLSAQKQEELYRQLQKQAEYWERQAAIVKTVVKLVRPTVVHIEAEPGLPSSPQRTPTQRVEEAGSGVVVQIQ
ncbi:MAG TPA: hypothetical protein PK777_09215, partial [Thermoguttaceae bacterium]|nr:hypothetical protein [Thermoguttaceae bacterium]